MPPRTLVPNGNGCYRCSELICAVQHELQFNGIWDATKSLFPVRRQFICVVHLPWNEATGRMVCILKFNGCEIDIYCSISILPLVEKEGGGTNYVKTVVK